MTDLEITRLCAEAMVLDVREIGEGEYTTLITGRGEYNPLYFDAQAMALVKKLQLHVGCTSDGLWFAEEQGRETAQVHDGGDLNRAICECVARIQQARAK